MKRIKTIILFSALLISVACFLSSCKKTWLCEEPGGGLVCIRGTDTIYSNIGLDNLNDYSNTYVQNLTNYYTSMGFTVTNGFNFTPTVVTDKTLLETLEQNGVQCSPQ